ncbi:hypothetical protein GCM10022254_68850 [Actinomadura meridiana]|uniref:Uncharacterized protein n=1 Tax=Actinomadura meridiana TaxID=559626 RepID=A0ABP8CN44_9ACTN
MDALAAVDAIDEFAATPRDAPNRHRTSGPRRPGRLAGLLSSVITFRPQLCTAPMSPLVNPLITP